MQRRELFSFLSLGFKDPKPKEEKVVRPPYYSDEAVFAQECIQCEGKCGTLCQEQIIRIGEDKTPHLDFSKNGCTYCDACALACEFGVLSVEAKHMINAHIAIERTKCLSHQGVMCFSCKDPCLEDAIIFHAMFMPSIDYTKCTSCGFCIGRCPTYAITVGEKNEISVFYTDARSSSMGARSSNASGSF